MNRLIGIIGNTLYIEPFYAGDHSHQATLSDWVKDDLIERGVPVLPDYDHIESFLYGMTHEDFVKQKIVWAQYEAEREAEDEGKSKDSGDLPF